MTQLQIIILFLAVVYFLGLLAFLPGLLRGLQRESEVPASDIGLYSSDFPKVTVLICARNEEKNLDLCLESLAGINYPSELLEILVVDDCSTDSTAAKLESWKKKLPHL